MARRLSLLLALLLVAVAAPAPAGAASTVTVTSPTEGQAASGTVRLSVDAPAGTVRVDYYVSRVLVATDATPKNGFGEAWDSRRALDGEHTVTARATGSGGSVLSEPVSFTVANEQAAPSPTPAPADPQQPPPPPGRRPDAPPPPSGDRGPSGPIVVWADNFDRGLDCSIWRRLQNAETSAAGDSACARWSPDGSPSRTTFPAGAGPDGSRAARFEVRSGDVSANGQRAELSGDGASWAFGEGFDGHLQQRIMVDPVTEQEQNGRFYILTQWHAGAGSPPLVLGLEDDGALSIESNGVGTVPHTIVLPASDFPEGVWFDVNVHFVMSNDPGKGGAEVFVDGARRTPWLAGRTMADGSSYLKLGQYRDPQPATGVTYVDDVRLSRR